MPFAMHWFTGFGPGTIEMFPNTDYNRAVVDTTGMITGAHSLYVRNLAAGSGYIDIKNKMGSLGSEIYFGVRFRPIALVAGLVLLFYLDDGNYVRLVWSTDGWDAYRGTTLLATHNIKVSPGETHHLQAHIVISDTGTFETLLDGNPDITYSGDTLPASGTDFSYLRIGPITSQGCYFDDMYWGLGGWGGAVRVDSLVPVADTATSEWETVSPSTPPGACTATATANAGLLNGTYTYKVTYIDGDSETALGTASGAVTPALKTVALTAIPTGPAGTTARRIYRTAAGGSDYYFVAELANNITTTYTDNIADSALGQIGPPGAWRNLEEVPGSDADFIWTDTDAEDTLVEIQDWVDTGKSPIAVSHLTRAFKSDAVTASVKQLLQSGATTDVGAEAVLLLTARYSQKTFATNPNGSIAWTAAAINALKAGVRSVIT